MDEAWRKDFSLHKHTHNCTHINMGSWPHIKIRNREGWEEAHHTKRRWSSVAELVVYGGAWRRVTAELLNKAKERERVSGRYKSKRGEKV